MRKLRIEYRRYFFRKHIEVSIPEKWEDLTSMQFSVCARLYTQEVSDSVFISDFFGIRRRLVKRLSKFEQYKLIECVEFISSPKAIVNRFFLRSIPGTNLFSPEPRLKDVTFEQFMLFDTFFFDYINEPKEDNLRKFVACIYTKEKEDISDFNFEKRLLYISKKIDKSTMYAIFLNYTFIRKWLSKAFGYLFEYSEPDEEKEDKPKNKLKPNRPDWNSLLDGLIGEDILHEEDYRKMKCIRAFKTINNRIKSYKNVK